MTRPQSQSSSLAEQTSTGLSALMNLPDGNLPPHNLANYTHESDSHPEEPADHHTAGPGGWWGCCASCQSTAQYSRKQARVSSLSQQSFSKSLHSWECFQGSLPSNTKIFPNHQAFYNLNPHSKFCLCSPSAPIPDVLVLHVYPLQSEDANISPKFRIL